MKLTKMRIKYTTTAPVSHIGETASVGSYFQTIKTASGRLPVITGNSVRGTLRDCGAKILLDTLAAKVGKEEFNVLFSGGNLNGTTKNDVGKAKTVRRKIPFISLFGGGLGDMIMSGKMSVGMLYPLTLETYEMLGEEYTDISWKHLIDEIEFTRTDDGKEDVLADYMINPEEEKTAKASTQMRFSVQYLARGTVFVQDIYFAENTTDIEYGAFFAALKKWFERPILGGMSAKGFGTFDAVCDAGISVTNGVVTANKEVVTIINQYIDYIGQQGIDVLQLLSSGGKKNGKA